MQPLLNTKLSLCRIFHLAFLIALFLGIGALARAATVTLTTPLDATDAAKSESNFGNLVADAMLAAASNADFAVCPAVEINPVTIDAGKSDTDRIASALRAHNDPNDTVEVMTLTGAQVIEALAHSVSRAPDAFQGFLQVSGLTVHYDISKRRAARIVSATVTKTGRAIDPQAKYKVVMSDYLADGALGYFAVWGAARASDTHVSMVDAVVRFVTNKQPVSCRIEGREVATR